MSASPVTTYAALYWHVAKLGTKALLARPAYLLIGPFIATVLFFVSALLDRLNTGILGGFVMGFLYAALLSLLLFAGRSIIEQRKMAVDDLQTGLGAFLNDTMTILFVAWIASMLLGFLHLGLLTLLLAVVPLVLPLLETAALSPAGGYATFGAAWRFVVKDAGPWLIGQVPLFVVLGAVYLAGQLSAELAIQAAFHVGNPVVTSIVGGSIDWALVLVAFVFRGILFLTLENYSPLRRAQRFGGADGLS